MKRPAGTSDGPLHYAHHSYELIIPVEQRPLLLRVLCLDVDGLIFAICRGGWPGALSVPDGDLQLEVARDLFWQTAHVDISKIDGVRRNPLWAEAIIRSYARNLCTTAQKKTLVVDVRANCESGETALSEYIAALEKLRIVSDIPAWSPAIRSKTSIRATRKRNLVDPSIPAGCLAP